MSLAAHLATQERWDAAHEKFQESDEYEEAITAYQIADLERLDCPNPYVRFEASPAYADAFEAWHETEMEPPS